MRVLKVSRRADGSRPAIEFRLHAHLTVVRGLDDHDRSWLVDTIGRLDGARSADVDGEIESSGILLPLDLESLDLLGLAGTSDAVLDVARSEDWSPRSVRQLARQVEDATQELAQEHRCSPDDQQIAQRLDIPVSELRRMRERIQHGMTRALDSRQELDRQDDSDHLVDRTVPDLEELLEDREMHGYLRAALGSLSERHRIVIVGLYLEGRSFEEIAELLGVTPSRVSQLRSDALEIIRHGIESQFREQQPAGKPKGRVAIRQARYAAEIARRSDFRGRLSAGTAWPTDPTDPVDTALDVERSADGAELASTA